MENTDQHNRQLVIQAVLFAVFLVLIVCVNRLWQTDAVHYAWKAAASLATGLLIFYGIDRNRLMVFGGFCMMMLGLGLLWQEETIPAFWKIFASLIVILQFGSLGEPKSDSPRESSRTRECG